jgi:MYXO-CTERM domain-containing protein
VPKNGKRFSNLNGVVVGDKVVVVFDVTTGSQSGIPTGEVDVQAIIVGEDGVPSMDPVVIASAPGRQDRPAVANDGTNLMVLWRHVGSGGSRIIARRFTHELTPIAGEAVVAESGTSVVSAPALQWTGMQFVAAWAEPQEAATVFSACVVDSATGCVPKSQTQIKEALFPTMPAGREGDIPNLLAAPSLVWSPSGGVWLYGRIDTTPHVGTVRVFGRGLSLGAAGAIAPDAGVNGIASDDAGDRNNGGHTGGGGGPLGSVGGASGGDTNGGAADMKGEGAGCSCRLAQRGSPSRAPWILLLAGLGLVIKTRAVRRIKRWATVDSLPFSNGGGLKPTMQRFEVTIDSNGGLYETLGRWPGEAFDREGTRRNPPSNWGSRELRKRILVRLKAITRWKQRQFTDYKSVKGVFRGCKRARSDLAGDLAVRRHNKQASRRPFLPLNEANLRKRARLGPARQ